MIFFEKKVRYNSYSGSSHRKKFPSKGKLLLSHGVIILFMSSLLIFFSYLYSLIGVNVLEFNCENFTDLRPYIMFYGLLIILIFLFVSFF